MYVKQDNQRRIDTSEQVVKRDNKDKLLAKAEILLQLSLSHISDEALAKQIEDLIEQIKKA